jgi:hypothetical protein
MTLARLLAAIAALGLLSACGTQRREHTAGWVKVTVETAYKGKPVQIVAYARCVSKWVRGGSFGATPGTGTISTRPKSAGKTMDDGSFIAFQMPELCGKYFDKRAPWEFTPTPFVPLMVWSDKKRRPTLMEAYLGEKAFSAPGSKLASASGVATPLTTVDDAVADSTVGLPNVVLQDSGLISDENEIGYKAGERGFRAAYGWPTMGKAGDEAAQECVTNFRSGQLVPDREVHGHLTLGQCKDALASVVPFMWDGESYRADRSRTGILVFQRVDPRMNGRRNYLVDDEVVWPAGDMPPTSERKPFRIDWVSAPARDPNNGI